MRLAIRGKVRVVAKKNWVATVKKIVVFVLDLLKESEQNSSSKGGSTNRPSQTAGKPSTTDRGANRGTQNSKPKPSTLPHSKPANRTNSNTSTTGKSPALSEHYPGDYTGKVTPQYSPELDGEPDPGEIVWTWVPFEEDYSQGKDRPVLLVGSDGPWLLGLMLTSKDHTAPGKVRSGSGPRWLDIGSGPWDSQGRDSEIRLDRVIRIHPDHMRREGAIMPKKTFTTVARAL